MDLPVVIPAVAAMSPIWRAGDDQINTARRELRQEFIRIASVNTDRGRRDRDRPASDSGHSEKVRALKSRERTVLEIKVQALSAVKRIVCSDLARGSRAALFGWTRSALLLGLTARDFFLRHTDDSTHRVDKSPCCVGPFVIFPITSHHLEV
jgi:hypothetical protein